MDSPERPLFKNKMNVLMPFLRLRQMYTGENLWDDVLVRAHKELSVNGDASSSSEAPQGSVLGAGTPLPHHPSPGNSSSSLNCLGSSRVHL